MIECPPFGNPSCKLQGDSGKSILSTREVDQRAGFLLHLRCKGLLFHNKDLKKSEIRSKFVISHHCT